MCCRVVVLLCCRLLYESSELKKLEKFIIQNFGLSTYKNKQQHNNTATHQ